MTTKIKTHKETYVIIEDENIPVKEWNKFFKWVTSDDLDEGGIYYGLGGSKIGYYLLMTSEDEPFHVEAGFEITGYNPEVGNFFISKGLLKGLLEYEEAGFDLPRLPPILRKLRK